MQNIWKRVLKINKKTFFKNILRKYHVVVYNEETLEEKVSLALSPINIIWLLSILIILTFTLSYVLISFTPLKESIPGIRFEDADDPLTVYHLEQRVDSLTEVIKIREERISSLLKLIITTDSDQTSYSSGKPSFISTVSFTSPTKNTEETSFEHGLFAPPVKGFISSGYLASSEHLGLDIVAARNTPIQSIDDGTVILSEWTVNTGNVMVIQHAGDYLSVYKHNSVNLKKSGTFVHKGEAVAIIGNSGELTTGPHLHFELWRKGAPVNPREFILF